MSYPTIDDVTLEHDSDPYGSDDNWVEGFASLLVTDELGVRVLVDMSGGDEAMDVTKILEQSEDAGDSWAEVYRATEFIQFSHSTPFDHWIPPGAGIYLLRVKVEAPGNPVRTDEFRVRVGDHRVLPGELDVREVSAEAPARDLGAPLSGDVREVDASIKLRAAALEAASRSAQGELEE